MATVIARFMADQSGATAIEYAAIGSMISIVILAACFEIGDTVKGQFLTVVGAFAN